MALLNMSRSSRNIGRFFAMFATFCFQSSASAQTPADKPTLGEELPRIAATEPDKALDTFTVQQGFRLELVASEPQVSDPVDACFDEHGRMFVAEMHGYPFSQEPTRLNPKGGGKPDAGIIRLLEDTDGDGRMDVSVKFADGIRWPTSVCCWDGGVFVLAPPRIWYFKDTDGDNVADVREVVVDGFSRANVQGVANNLKWGLDNRIYGAGGRNPSTLQRDGKDVLKVGSNDFSIDPRTLTFRPETGGRQFGHSFDDWGNRFVCTNSNHIQHIVFPYDALSRNPHYAVSGSIRSIAKEGAAAPVFRRSSAEPWRMVRTRRRVADPKYARLPATERVPIGFFTSATGVTVYRGAAWPDEYRGHVLIGDVGGNLVHRKRLQRNGASFVATRTDEKAEFIASTDNWFRPTNFVNAPDGTLYVLDMYRETIEHPYSIPDDIKDFLRLESGDDRGRIYRLLGPNGRRLKVDSLGGLSTAELVARLESPNGWTRETAHRLLFERQDNAAVEPLRKLVRDSDSALGRMHAMYVLHSLNALATEDLQHGIAAAEHGVREHAVRLAATFLPDDTEVSKSLLKLTADQDQRVLFQLAMTLGQASPDTAAPGLLQLLQRSDVSADVRSATMTSIDPSADRVLIEAFKDGKIIQAGSRNGWLTTLVTTVASRRDTSSLLSVLAKLSASELPAARQGSVLLAADAALRRRGARLRTTLADPRAVSVRLQLAAILTQAVVSVIDDSRPETERSRSIRLLQLSDEDTAVEVLSELLSPTVPQSLQRAAVASLAGHGTTKAAPILIEHWRGFSPKVRTEVVDVLTSSVPFAGKLLDAIGEGQVRSAELSRERKQLLLNHPNTQLRDLAKKQFAAEVNVDRAAVVKSYQSALDLEIDVERGRALFMKKCSVCHRVGTEGKQVGPDIVSVTNKSAADLLLAILDPNREAQPNFNVYTVVTEAGRVFNGIIVAESASSITLRRAEGKEDGIARVDIAQLVSSGKSLMPEGLEKDLSKQQIADAIAFIRSLGQAKK